MAPNPLRGAAAVALAPERNEPEARPIDRPRRLAVSAMTRFSCLATACEANCCGHWAIPIDAEGIDRLEQALAGEDGRSISDLVQLRAGPAEPGTPSATIRLGPDGRCPLLAGDGTCTIHRKLGEEALGDTCATYPRTVLRVGQREELAGRLSCPEVARLVLLADDGPELVPAMRPAGERRPPGRTIDPERDGTLWTGAFDEVRETILAVLRREELGLAERVVLIADLADRVGSYFHAGSPALAHGGEAGVAERLGEALELTADPALALLLRDRVSAMAVPPGPATALLIGVIQERARSLASPAFASLSDDVLTGWRVQVAGPDSTDETPVDAQAVGEAWVARQRLLDGRYPETMARILRNWSLYWWTLEPYVGAASLTDHACRFALLLALYRLLLTGHPQVGALLDAGDDGPQARACLERIAVEVAMTFSRAFEHDRAFLSAVDAALCAEGPHSFARTICLASMI